MKKRNTIKSIYSRIGKWAIAAFLLSVLLVQQTVFARHMDGERPIWHVCRAKTTITINRPATTAVNWALAVGHRNQEKQPTATAGHIQ